MAFTQNLVSRHELGAVLDFMKSRPTHVSGFKRAPSSCAPVCDADADAACEDDEAAPAELYGLFCARLREYDEALLEDALRQVREKEEARKGRTTRVEARGSGWWRRMKAEDGTPALQGKEGEAKEESNGFAALLDDEELEDVPW